MSPTRKGRFFEPEPEGEAGIVVRNLRKEFRSLTGGKMLAVDDVSFSAFRGQITALLGHNGAGKTTTMSVLTGMYSPSGGSAIIGGYDISTQMDKIRQSLGLCPQHNMLFTDLTVKEHLLFFGMVMFAFVRFLLQSIVFNLQLKGLSRTEANIQADDYIEKINLEPKKHTVVTSLSGGMKRKVNLGIALIGNSEVVMLDEPTSGMDPEARRGMWDLLQEAKRDKTILLTTHFMEEADVLGDRIAIMNKGKVDCYGSPMFLKREFGSGYTLTMTRDPHCDVRATKNLIREEVEGAKLKSDASGELVFNLPGSESKKFAKLFERLEQEKDGLGVLNFGLSVTTMEDVFLKVGSLELNEEEEEEEEQDKVTVISNGNGLARMSSVASSRYSEVPESLDNKRPKLRGLKLWMSQMKGLLLKRIIYTKRRWILYSFMVSIS